MRAAERASYRVYLASQTVATNSGNLGVEFFYSCTRVFALASLKLTRRMMVKRLPC